MRARTTVSHLLIAGQSELERAGAHAHQLVIEHAAALVIVFHDMEAGEHRSKEATRERATVSTTEHEKRSAHMSHGVLRRRKLSRMQA